MTKRTNKPKATQTVAPTINSTAPVSSVESVKAESKAKVATKPKQAPSKPRARSKKVVVKVDVPELTQQDKDARILRANVTVTQVEPETLVEQTPSKYEQFKVWLVFKLYVVTSFFRGY